MIAGRSFAVGVALLIGVGGFPARSVELVTAIVADGPLEISGVAALPDGSGYAVVGDDTDTHGRIWPGGAVWSFGKARIRDTEAVEVGRDENGEELWLVLGEEDRVLAEPDPAAGLDRRGAGMVLPKIFESICGRGLEGLTLRRKNGVWQAVILWEGGYYNTRRGQRDCGGRRWDRPKIAMVTWEKGRGSTVQPTPTELQVPLLPGPEATRERFRATDIAWYGEDELIVLLGSTGIDGRPPWNHTWLQRFRRDGSPVGKPVRLEGEKFWKGADGGSNWEALDTTPDGKNLILGRDTASGPSDLVVIRNPFIGK